MNKRIPVRLVHTPNSFDNWTKGQQKRFMCWEPRVCINTHLDSPVNNFACALSAWWRDKGFYLILLSICKKWTRVLVHLGHLPPLHIGFPSVFAKGWFVVCVYQIVFVHPTTSGKRTPVFSAVVFWGHQDFWFVWPNWHFLAFIEMAIAPFNCKRHQTSSMEKNLMLFHFILYLAACFVHACVGCTFVCNMFSKMSSFNFCVEFCCVTQLGIALVATYIDLAKSWLGYKLCCPPPTPNECGQLGNRKGFLKK